MSTRFNQSPFAVVVTAARDEALRRGDKRIGTEHLLLGLLREFDSVSTGLLRVDLDAAHAALHELDRDALSAVGIDVRELALRPAPARRTPPMTSAAAATLQRAGEEASTRRVRDVGTEHLLRALLTRPRPDAAAELLDALGVDRAEVARRLDEFA